MPRKLTAAEEEGIRQAIQSIDRGEGIPWEEVRARLAELLRRQAAAATAAPPQVNPTSAGAILVWMKRDEEKVLAEALRLPSSSRAAIAGRLLRSLDEEDDEDPAEVQAAWTTEIDRRRRELATGAVKPMTRDEARRFIASDDPADDNR